MVTSWSETALVTLNIQGVAQNFHMACMTESIEIDAGEQGFESIATVCGSRITKFNPEEDTTITLEAYPLEAAFNEGASGDVDGVWNLLYGAQTVTGGAVSFSNAIDRRPVRLVFRWTVESGVDAEDVLTGDQQNLRIAFADGYITSAKPSFSDKIMKVTMEFKFSPYDRDGTGNFLFESIDGSGATPTNDLTALANYTSTVKFR